MAPLLKLLSVPTEHIPTPSSNCAPDPSVDGIPDLRVDDIPDPSVDGIPDLRVDDIPDLRVDGIPDLSLDEENWMENSNIRGVQLRTLLLSQKTVFSTPLTVDIALVALPKFIEFKRQLDFEGGIPSARLAHNIFEFIRYMPLFDPENGCANRCAWVIAIAQDVGLPLSAIGIASRNGHESLSGILKTGKTQKWRSHVAPMLRRSDRSFTDGWVIDPALYNLCSIMEWTQHLTNHHSDPDSEYTRVEVKAAMVGRPLSWRSSDLRAIRRSTNTHLNELIGLYKRYAESFSPSLQMANYQRN